MSDKYQVRGRVNFAASEDWQRTSSESPRHGRRNRGGTSLTEIAVGMCLMSFGLIPITRGWVDLTRQTGQFTERSQTHILLAAALDAYSAYPVRDLIRLADAQGRLPQSVQSAQAGELAQAVPSRRFIDGIGSSPGTRTSAPLAGGDRIPIEAFLRPVKNGYHLVVRSVLDHDRELEIILPRVKSREVPRWS